MRIANDKGIALLLTLFLTTAMSVIAASLMLLSQTETYSSFNYRLMSQARYGAESGVQMAANYLLYTYVPPVENPADPIANYNTNVSPVTCANGCPNNGQPVVLSGSTTQASNYPVAGVQANFLAAVQGTLPAGNTTVAYAPYATLMSMQQIEVYGGGVQTIQTWQITSTGSITAGRTAEVEVSAILETPKFPAQLYGAFGTNPGCGSLTFSGSSQTNSYDSSALVGGNPVISDPPSGGNVGTNGNLGESGNATINGTLSSPRVGVGACSDGNVDALTSSGNATVTGGVLQLPQAVVLPPPTAPPSCADGGPCQVPYNGNNQTLLNGMSYGDVTVSSGTLTLCLPATTCTINVNSIKFTGNATIEVALGATVILNVAGTGQATPIDLTGGSTTNTSFDPSALQIQYAGTGEIRLGGNSSLTAMVYAPNAATTLSGDNAFYGSLVSGTVNVTGNANIYYDRHLSSEFFTVGSPMMSSFSWKKY